MTIIESLLCALLLGGAHADTSTPRVTPVESGDQIILTRQDPEDEDDEEESEEEKKRNEAEAFRLKVNEDKTRVTWGDLRYMSGRFQITWGDPEKFYNDVKFFGKNRPKHTLFHPSWLRQRGPRRSPLEGKICVSGNNRGSLLLYPHFKGPIEVEAKVYFNLIDKFTSCSFMLTVHDDKKDFVGSDYGVHIVQGRKKKKPKFFPSAAHKDPAGKWMDRTLLHTISMRYDPETGDFDTSLGGSRNSQKIENGPTSGQIGLRWTGTKFSLIQLQVKGQLDKEWVEKALKEARSESPTPGP